MSFKFNPLQHSRIKKERKENMTGTVRFVFDECMSGEY